MPDLFPPSAETSASPWGEAFRRLTALGVLPGLAAPLCEAAAACADAVRDFSPLLGPRQRQDLVLAYYRAESLAAYAIEDALNQAPPPYRAQLTEQLADEAEHIDVFGGWLGERPPVQRPKSKQRPLELWFALLAANEVTGYCQFAMLSAAVDEERRRQVLSVIEDEERHIARLAGWLRPTWPLRRGKLPQEVLARFAEALPGRMAQFFPDESLLELRLAVATRVSGAVRALPLG